MSGDTHRVRIVKGADLTPADRLCFHEEHDFTMPGHAEREYLVLDESPGVWLEGVTAEDVRAFLDIDSDQDEGERYERTFRALRKAAES